MGKERAKPISQYVGFREFRAELRMFIIGQILSVIPKLTIHTIGIYRMWQATVAKLKMSIFDEDQAHLNSCAKFFWLVLI